VVNETDHKAFSSLREEQGQIFDVLGHANTVYSINPKSADRACDRFSPAGVKR
jgi:hypothetical protein